MTVYKCGLQVSGELFPHPTDCPQHGALCDDPAGWYQQLRTLRAALQALPRYVVSELDDMLLPNPVPDGDWVPWSHIDRLLQAASSDDEDGPYVRRADVLRCIADAEAAGVEQTAMEMVADLPRYGQP